MRNHIQQKSKDAATIGKISIVPLSLNFFKVGPTSKMEAASR